MYIIDNSLSIKLLIIFTIFFYSTVNYSKAETDVNPYLKRYSKINFDSNDLNYHHNRVSRSIDDHIKISFKAHGREFHLKLAPSQSSNIVSDQIEINQKLEPISNLKMYEGILIDEPETSRASGAIINGAFIGQIESKDGTFYIEPAKRFETSGDSNAIIYHESDVETNEEVLKKRNERSGSNIVNHDSLEGDIGCGATNKNIRMKLAEEQSKADTEARKKRDLNKKTQSFYKESDYFRYSREANDRKKRQNSEFPESRVVCNMYLKVDPYLYDTIYKKEGNNNDVLTRDYLLYYLNKQVESLKTIFKSISSTQSAYFQTLTFKISKIKIYKFADCTSANLTTEEKKLCENYLDPITFLNYISLDNFDNYCLGFAFTSRDFSDGTLGLAWLATTNGGVGGICEKAVSIQGVTKSLNTGFVTTVNFNARVPERVNQLTFAHEVGHALGSEHDPSSAECSPGSTAGNYIMYSRATTGNQQNNNRFSSCSVTQMNSILKNLLGTTKNCLKLINEAECGNGIIEGQEECDTGSAQGGKCCISCKRVGECDPSEGPCCNPDNCSFYRDNRTCLSKDDCKEDLKCSGTSAACPIEDTKFFKPDLSLCNNNTQVCKKGVCRDSICDKFNLTQCYVEGDLSNSNTNKSALCQLACNGTSTQNQCKLTNNIPEFQNQLYSLRPGSSCSGNLGYCDVFSRCRAVNANGTLAKLAKTLLAPTTLTIEDLKTFATNYWWAILLFCIAFLALNVIFLFCIWKHMDSDNPEKTRPHSIKNTLKNPLRAFKSREESAMNQKKASNVISMKPTAKEITPSVFYNDNRGFDSSDINLRSIPNSARLVKKTRRTPRSDE